MTDKKIKIFALNCAIGNLKTDQLTESQIDTLLLALKLVDREIKK